MEAKEQHVFSGCEMEWDPSGMADGQPNGRKLENFMSFQVPAASRGFGAFAHVGCNPVCALLLLGVVSSWSVGQGV